MRKKITFSLLLISLLFTAGLMAQNDSSIRSWKDYSPQMKAKNAAKSPKAIQYEWEPQLYAYCMYAPEELLGFMSFYPSTPEDVTMIKKETEYLLNAGEYYNGYLYGFTYTFSGSYAVPHSFVRITPGTGARQTLNYVADAGGTMDNSVVYDMAYSYKDGVMYAIKNTANGPMLTTVKLANPNSGTHREVGIISNGPTRFIALACHLNGDLYALGTDTKLYKINMDNMSAELIGETKLPGMNITMNIQAMAFDHNSGVLYWATETGLLYIIDHNTARIRLAGNISNYSGVGVVGLFSTYKKVEEGSPAMPEAFAVSVGDNGSISSSLQWMNPVETAQGEGDLQITAVKIYRDEVLVHTITQAVAGRQESLNDAAVTEGAHTYKVVAENENGEGIPASLSVFVGTDTPNLATEVSLVKDNNGNAYLSWAAPTTGVNKGWIGDLKYDIVRLPDNVKVASDITSLNYTDSSIPKMEYYSYKITAKNSKRTGESVTSNALVFGSASIPWYEDFNKEISGVYWTLYDVNMNGECWGWFERLGVNGTPCVGFNPYLVEFDDWLISPPLRLEAGKKYRLRWSETSNDYGQVRYSLYMGTDNTVDGQTTLLSERTSQSFLYLDKDQTLPAITATGDYHVSWHLKGRAFPYIYFDNIYVEELNDIDLKLDALENNRSVSVDIPVTTKVIVKNYGANAASNFKVTLYDNSDNVLAVSTAYTGSIQTDETAEILITWVPTAGLENINTLKATVEIANDKDLSNNSTSTVMLVYPTGNVQISASNNYVRTGDNNDMPFNLSQKNSMAQSLIYANEINTFGYIESITFYSRFTTDVASFPVKIYLATTDKTNTMDWHRENTLVYEGNISISHNSQQVQQTKIILDKPFLYEGGNLVVSTERVMHDVVYAKDDVHFLKGQSLGTNTPNRTAIYSSDDTAFNYQRGSRVETFAYMDLGMSVKGNALQGKVTSNGNPVGGVLVKVNNTDIETLSDSNGDYKLVYVPAGSHQVSYYKSGYEENVRTLTINHLNVNTENVSLSAVQNYTVSGKVTNGGSNLSNVDIILSSDYELFHVVSDQNGNFTIPNVPGKQSYTINASLSGYSGYSATQAVATSNVTGLNINMNTCSGTAINGLKHTINTPEWYTVNLSWNEPTVSGLEVSGYRIYRNDELVNYDLLTTTSFSEKVPAGTYTYSVSAVWNNSCESAKVSTSSFTIDVYGCDIAINTFPFEEGFEGNQIHSCWAQEYVSGIRYNWTFVDCNNIADQRPATAHSGRYYIRIYGDGKGSTARLMSPMMDITELNNPALSFWHTQEKWIGDSQDVLKVFYKNSPEGEWNLLAEYKNDIVTWKEEVLSLPNASATYWIAFEGSINYGRGVALDDMKVFDDICKPAQNLSYVQESETSLTLSWEKPIAADILSYDVKRDGTLIASELETTSVLDTDLSIGNHKYEVIVNYDKSFCNAASAEINVPVVGKCDPIDSLGLEIVSVNSIKLTWEKPKAIDVVSYTIRRNNETLDPISADKTEFIDTNLPERNYKYQVMVNYSGKDCNTSQVTDNSIILMTRAVDNLTAKVVENNKVSLNWEVLIKDIASFEIYRDGVLIDEVRDLFYNDRFLDAGKTYEYKVIPVYDAGWEGAASTVNATLDCEEVSNAKLSFINDNKSVVLSWGKQTNASEESLIWDNGGFVTHPGAGFSGYDLSMPYDGGTKFGIEIERSLGFTHTDDFTLEADTYIDEMEFYAYIPIGPLSPSPVEGVYIAIFDGDPSVDGELIWGTIDANNLLKSSEFSGVFRTHESIMSNVERPIYKIKAAINETFPKGKYWVFVTMDGSTMFGTIYAVPVSILGNLNTGDASILVPDYENSRYAWIKFGDSSNGATYGLPFKVFGEEESEVVDIYRDGILIASDVSGNTYTDNDVPAGKHIWRIVRKCGEGDSAGIELRGGDGVGINDSVINTDNISVYPNPAKDIVTVAGEEINRLRIVDMDGRIIKEEELDRTTNKHVINISECSDGIYILQVYTDSNVSSKKLFIKK
ncbi:carboxypeptidase regulatory-like domain-containing protein [Bacteroidales bacterium OttesenSCG-928-I14]|nr:carboxypeptidase regulatory-like domain-containing protein [Bacteroidales bacterium OttesenSCG-928-I14]